MTTNQYKEALEKIDLTNAGEVDLKIGIHDEVYSVIAEAAVQLSNNNLSALHCTFPREFIGRFGTWNQLQGGFSVEIIYPENRDNVELRINSENIDFEDQFFNLCHEICSIIEEGSGPEETVSKIHKHIIKTVKFYQNVGFGILSRENQIGLYGELYLLNELLDRLSSQLVVDSWRGSNNAPQDFQFPNLAIEVKTSTSTQRGDLNINGIDQLDSHSIDTLFLSYLRFSRNPSAGQTLPEIIELIRSKIESNPSAEYIFNERLEARKYFDDHKEKYEEKYSFIEQLNYLVEGDDFPRILQSHLITGIKSVKYSISSIACEPFLKDEDCFYEKIKHVEDS